MCADKSVPTRAVEQLYHMVRELTAELELRAVIRKVLSFAISTTGASAGSMMVLDDEGELISAIIKDGDRVVDNATLQLGAVLEHGLAGWVIRNRQPAFVPDTSKDERWFSATRGQENDLRSAIAVPLIVEEHLVGVLTVVHNQPHAFEEKHFLWARSVGDLASAMVMNALLYDRSRRQAHLMRVWAESAMTITGTLETEEIIKRMLKQIELGLRVEAVLLAMASEPNWIVTDASGVLAERLLGVRLQAPEAENACPQMENSRVLGVRAQTCVPLMVEDTLVGALIAVNPLEGRFRPDMKELLQGIANMASTALRNARLFRQANDAHRQYRALFNDTLDWIFITDLQGNIIEANQRAKVALGFSWEDLRSGTLSITKVHQLPEVVWLEGLNNIPTSPPISYESEVQTVASDAVPVEVYVRRVHLDNQPHLQWILRDITERKRLETMRNDLLAMLYHDLRAPLSSINMSLELLGQVQVEDERRELIAIAQRATDRLGRLTANMLDLGRLETGQMPLHYQQVQPAQLIEEVIEAVAHHLKQRKHTLETAIESHLPPVRADSEVMRRVLINLLENAIKYIPIKGHIQVGAARQGDFVRFWVTDNGPGIPLEERHYIFEKYARGSSQGGKGLGLGLAFARLAVQAHGGEIGVESKVGEGSTFFFTLPITEESQTGLEA